jgi:hypothetical protein
MAWLSGYSYRKSITLSRASGAVTNYQMKLLVGESSGASGEDVDCNSHCATDFDDLRFTTSDETTLLDYWIESVSGTTPNQLATVWIEFNSIGTGATTFYMYYGNSGASAATSGTNTFPFFDNFPTDSLNTDLWSDDSGAGCDATISSGILTCKDNNGNWSIVKAKTGFGNTYAIRAYLNSLHYGSQSYHETMGFYNSNNTSQEHIALAYSGSYVAKYGNYIDVTHNSYSAISGYTANTWAVFDIKRNSTTNVVYMADNANSVTINTNLVSGTLYPLLASGNTNAKIQAKWVLVRQFLGTEPAWGSWGSEEAGGATLPLKNVFNRPFRGVFR